MHSCVRRLERTVCLKLWLTESIYSPLVVCHCKQTYKLIRMQSQTKLQGRCTFANGVSRLSQILCTYKSFQLCTDDPISFLPTERHVAMLTTSTSSFGKVHYHCTMLISEHGCFNGQSGIKNRERPGFCCDFSILESIMILEDQKL